MRDRGRVNEERLKHIIEAIQNFTKNFTKEKFIRDAKTNNAVLFQFTVIGEAITAVDPDLLRKYKYPWHKVRALRNIIAHEYFGIRMDMIWEVIAKELPVLKKVISRIIREEFE